MNYPLTITAGEGEGACSKGHSPKSSPVQCYTPKEGGVRDALIVYRMFIADEVSVYRISCERWQTKPVLTRHSQVGRQNS